MKYFSNCSQVCRSVRIFLQYEQMEMNPSRRFTLDRASLSSSFWRCILSAWRFASACSAAVILLRYITRDATIVTSVKMALSVSVMAVSLRHGAI